MQAERSLNSQELEELLNKILDFKEQRNIDTLLDAITEYCDQNNLDTYEIGEILSKHSQFREVLYKELKSDNILRDENLLEDNKINLEDW